MENFDEVLLTSFANGMGIGVGAICAVVMIPIVTIETLIKNTKDWLMPEDSEEKKVSWLKAD